MQATAHVPTLNARRYLGQFCKHFAHKLPATASDTLTTGHVVFGAGTCHLRADEHGLNLEISGATTEDLVILQAVVARHLIRFAFREDLAVNWGVPA